MEVIVLLLLASLGLATSFLLVFVWATRSGQFDDTTTPAMRILAEDPPAARPGSPPGLLGSSKPPTP